MGKPFWKSKTFWANAVASVLSVASLVFGVDLDVSQEVQTAIVGGIMGVVNIALRFMTHEPVTVK